MTHTGSSPRRPGTFARAAASLLLLAAAVSLPVAPAATAQEGGGGRATPESVAAAYMAAAQAQDWARCASLMHPDALDEIRRSFLRLAALDKSGGLRRELLGAATEAEAASLSGAAVFERVIRFVMRQAGEVNVSLDAAPPAVLGHVVESPDLAHVVYRSQIKIGDSTVRRLGVITLKSEGDTWRALLSGEMENMLEAIERSVAATSARPQPRRRQPPPPQPRRRPRGR